MTGTADLEGWFRARGRVLLGYSGGIDSTLLAVVGTRTLGPVGFLAVIGRSGSYPEAQWRDAIGQAAQHGVPVEEVDTDELADPSYRANAPDRCYFCKRELWAKLGAIAVTRGFDTVIDGTHADDLAGHRPGTKAGLESGIRSPLAELGWTKAKVREAALALGIEGWDAPSSPCLSSRIQYGLEVTPDRLGQVERAESLLRALGIRGDLRVRHHGPLARIEVDRAMFPLLDEAWPDIVAGIQALGFQTVERDPVGYRRGSLLPLAS